MRRRRCDGKYFTIDVSYSCPCRCSNPASSSPSSCRTHYSYLMPDLFPFPPSFSPSCPAVNGATLPDRIFCRSTRLRVVSHFLFSDLTSSRSLSHQKLARCNRSLGTQAPRSCPPYPTAHPSEPLPLNNGHWKLQISKRLSPQPLSLLHGSIRCRSARRRA